MSLTEPRIDTAPPRTPAPARSVRSASSPGISRSEWPWALSAVVVLAGASLATLALVRHLGAGFGGDEPYYLAAAVSIGRYHTLNMNAGLNWAVTHHAIFPWHAVPGPHLATQIGQPGSVLVDHTIYLPSHAIGLSVLLALPVLAGTYGAVCALVLVLAVLSVGLTYLMGEVIGLRSPWRYAMAALFLVPSYLVATTQVYPDLVSGLAVAIVLMLVALAERRGRLTPYQLVAGTTLMVALPWLDQKNVLLALVPLAALLVAGVRQKLSIDQLGWLAGAGAVSILALVAFNLWGWGHPLGQVQTVSITSWETFTRALALLIDRRQGLIVQVPLVLLGFAGAWVMRRRIPISVVAAGAFVALDILGNATQKVSFGGGSFVGRFQWPAMPILLAFAGLYLVELWRVRRRAAVVLMALGGLAAVIEAIPIVLDEHVYFNQYVWDPSSYSGWWGSLDPSPVLAYLGGVLVSGSLHAASDAPVGIAGLAGAANPWSTARNLWGVATLVLGAALVIVLLVRLVAPRTTGSAHRARLTAGLVSATALALVLTLSSPQMRPPPVTFGAASLSSQGGLIAGTGVASGPSGHGTVIDGPNWTLLPGRYLLAVHYRLDDTEPGVAPASVVAVAGRRPVTLESRALSNGHTVELLPFRLDRTEQVGLSVGWLGSGTLQVNRIVLAKVAQS